MLKAVIFDLGGTLMSFEDTEITFREVTRIGIRGLYVFLQERKTTALPEWPLFCAHLDDCLEQAWQDSLNSLRSTRLERILPAALSRWPQVAAPEDTPELLAHFHRAMQPYVSLYDDTIATLGEFRQRGLRIGLISNTIWPPEMHDLDLERLGILGFFDHRLYSSAHDYVKPHPAIFQHSLAALGVSAAEAIFVGDRLRDDVGGAQGAGIKAVLKEMPERQERDDQIVPDARIKALRELWDIILDTKG